MIDADFYVTRGNTKIHFSMKDSGLILLTGVNGAGKTTSLLCMAGSVMQDAGTLSINDKKIFGLPSGIRSIVYINQNSYFSGLTVRDHLRIVSPQQEKMQEVLEMFSLDAESKVEDLSQGNKMRVSVSTAILSSPVAILLDEIISNISEPEKFIEVLREGMKKYSFDVVFVTQNEKMAELSDHHYVISEGNTRRVF